MNGLLVTHRRMRRRRSAVVIGLTVLLFAGLLLDLVTGPAGVPVGEALASLFHTGDVSLATDVIVWRVRLPMALMAVLVGAALGLAGVEMQTILDNALAEPFTLGVSAAAALGAATAIILGLGLPGVGGAWLIPGNAFVFSLSALLLLQAVLRLPGADMETIVLFGVALGFCAGTALSLLQFAASPDALQQLAFWSMGSLSRSDWQGVGVLATVLCLTIPFSLRDRWRMTMLLLGEERARGAGVDVRRLRRFALIRISLLAAAAVSFVGVIGFVGLAAPHMARLVIGEDHRHLMPASLLTGGVLMSFASVVSKIVVPGVILPVGIVTATIGLPLFLLLIIRRGRRA